MSTSRPVVLILPPEALTSAKSSESDPHNEVERRRKLKISKAIKELSETLSPSCQCGKETRADILQKVMDRIKALQTNNTELEAKISKLSPNTGSESDLQSQLIATVQEHVILKAVLFKHQLDQRLTKDNDKSTASSGASSTGTPPDTAPASVSTTETQTTLSSSPPWPVSSLLTHSRHTPSTQGPATHLASQRQHRSANSSIASTATHSPVCGHSCMDSRPITTTNISSSGPYTTTTTRQQHECGAQLSGDRRLIAASGRQIVQPWVTSSRRLQHLSSQPTSHPRASSQRQRTRRGAHRPYHTPRNSQEFGQHAQYAYANRGGSAPAYEYPNYDPHQMSYNPASVHHAPPYHSHVMSCDSPIVPHPPHQPYLSHTPTPPHQNQQTVWRPYSETNRSSGFCLSDILSLPSSEDTPALGMGPSTHPPAPPQSSGRIPSFLVDRLLDDM